MKKTTKETGSLADIQFAAEAKWCEKQDEKRLEASARPKELRSFAELARAQRAQR